MSDVPPELTAEFERCMREEKLAWKAVGGSFPGTLRHDHKAWLAWVGSSQTTDVARKRVQVAILSSPPHAAPAGNEGPPGAVTDNTPHDDVRQSSDGVADAASDVPSQPMPLSGAPGANLRFSSIVREAGFQEGQFRTNLLRFGPGELSDGNYMVTVTCSRLGLSRTYEAADEGGWLSAFEQDLRDGVFSAGEAETSGRA